MTGLVFDIGFNNGDDTAHYLARGFRVVAVEANPDLVKAGQARFADAIKDGRLELIGAALSETSGGNVPFYVNAFDGRSSCIPEAGMLGGSFHVISVPTVTIGDLFARFGTPYYLKVDIEGNDWFCLRDLPEAPQYISVEAHRLEYLAVLYVRGYRQFKIVNQAEFAGMSSGPVSDTITDWESLETVAYDYLHVRLGRERRSSLGNGWFDFHAKLGGEELQGGYAKKPLRFRTTKRHYYRLRTLFGQTRLGGVIKSLIRPRGRAARGDSWSPQ
jgi:FkbM family methyltransferase